MIHELISRLHISFVLMAHLLKGSTISTKIQWWTRCKGVRLYLRHAFQNRNQSVNLLLGWIIGSDCHHLLLVESHVFVQKVVHLRGYNNCANNEQLAYDKLGHNQYLSKVKTIHLSS